MDADDPPFPLIMAFAPDRPDITPGYEGQTP